LLILAFVIFHVILSDEVNTGRFPNTPALYAMTALRLVRRW